MMIMVISRMDCENCGGSCTPQHQVRMSENRIATSLQCVDCHGLYVIPYERGSEQETNELCVLLAMYGFEQKAKP